MDPISIGGATGTNVTGLSFQPKVALPAGALLFMAVGTNAANTAQIAVSDSAVGPGSTKNAYNVIVNSQQPASQVTLFVYLVINAIPLAVTDTITLTSGTRANLGMAGYYFPVGAGNIISSDVEWFNATALHYQCFARSNMQLLALLALAGPTSDTFTQDPAWGPDIPSGIPSAAVTVRACGRIASGGDGQYTWSPTLQTARQSVGLVCAFR